MKTAGVASQRGLGRCGPLWMGGRQVPGQDSRPGFLVRLRVRVRAAIRFEVPIGYQDETGFHYGEEPPAKEVRHPPFW